MGLLFSMGGLALGVLALYGAVHKHRQMRLVRDTPTSKVRALPMGPVEVKGRAEKHDEVLQSPFSGEDCVAYVYSINKYSEDSDGDTNWNTAEAGKKAVRFQVDDGTGSVLVAPEGAEMEMTRTNQYEVSDSEPAPEEVREFLGRRDELFENQEGFGITSMAELVTSTDIRIGDADDSGRRRYQEEYIPVGDEVYVFGRAEEREGKGGPANEQNIVVTKGDVPLFKISGGSEDEVLGQSRKMVVSGAVFGFLFSVAGFAALLHLSGIFFGFVFSLVSLGAAYAFNRKFSIY